ncbi:MAG: nuclear transport factor 2 family protein [Bacteroidota bacterium]
MTKIRLITVLLIISGCSVSTTKEDPIEKWKSEVAETERAFNSMAQKEGLAKAFEYFAADDGVINRRKMVIQGKSAIGDYYKEDSKPGDTLTWNPTFVDVSQSGDLAYTYGDYRFSYLDTLGNVKVSQGIFHTVWKRQEDGTWRFVWD